MERWINAIWLLTFLALFAIYFIPKSWKAYVAIVVVFLNSAITSWLAIPALTGQIVEISFNAGTLLGNSSIYIDGLSAWFILIINFTSVTGAVYGLGYLQAYNKTSFKMTTHWWLFVLFHLSMLWVCMLQNGFVFLIAWELMSLTSMFLVIFDSDNAKTLKAGINYLVQMHISVIFLTIGFIWVYSFTGSFSFESIRAFFQTNNNTWLFLVFFAGFGLKAGFIPLHSWLPHAHPAAPSHVSGVMSGVIVKLGIYGIFRIISFLQSDFIVLGEIIIFLSVLTGVYGILNAAVHRDFKRMLAYCTIENIGIIGIGIGIGLIGIGNESPVLYFLGFGGALLHVLNHSLFKSLLFYSAGSVYQQTHTRDMEKLGGLIKNMPRTAVVFLIGAIAIGGIPPFNGFVSEFIIYSGLIEGIKSYNLLQIVLFVTAIAGLSLIGGLSVLTFSKTFGTIFLGSPREKFQHQLKEVSLIMLLPQYLIIMVMLCVAFLPQYFIEIVGKIIQGMGKTNNIEASIIKSYSSIIFNVSLYSLLLIGIIGLLWFIRFFAIRKLSQRMEPTWGCGYIEPNARMQYSGKSFSKPLGKIFSFLLIEKKRYIELKPGEIFPYKRKYSSHYLDFFEFRFYDTIIQRLIYSANYFKFIQNGRVQSYVLYGIIFILAAFILTMFNFGK